MIMLATFSVTLVAFSMFKIGHQHPESVTNISNLSPTHLATKIRHQHRCNPRRLICKNAIKCRYVNAILIFSNSKRRISEGESIKVMSYNGMTRDKVFEVIKNYEANPNESRSTDTQSCQSLRKISTVSSPRTA